MSLSTERQLISDTLSLAGIKVYDHVPARLQPPAAVLIAGSPYLVPGERFGTFKVAWNISLIAGTAPNDQATDALDSLIEDAVVAVVNAGYDLEQVSEFGVFPSNNAEYPAVGMTIAREIEL